MYFIERLRCIGGGRCDPSVCGDGCETQRGHVQAIVPQVVRLGFHRCWWVCYLSPLERVLIDLLDASEGRKLVLLHLYDSLLDYFKVRDRRFLGFMMTDSTFSQSLMTPYMTFLLPPLIDLLNGFKGDLADTALWTAVVQTIHKSCSQDEGGWFSHSIGARI